VLHLQDFFLKRHSRNEIIHALLNGQRRIAKSRLRLAGFRLRV